jgi:ATP-binding cassette, subfamily B (MDR/TAP), member 1
MIGAALPLMTVIFGSLANVFGGFGSPGSSTVSNIPSVSDFNRQVSHFALQFVYLGIGVMVASFLGTFFWTLSGERISRRIRG